MFETNTVISYVLQLKGNYHALISILDLSGNFNGGAKW